MYIESGRYEGVGGVFKFGSTADEESAQFGHDGGPFGSPAEHLNQKITTGITTGAVQELNY